MNDKLPGLGFLTSPPTRDEALAEYYKQQRIENYIETASMQFAILLCKDALDVDGPSAKTIAKKAKELAQALAREVFPDAAP